MAHVLLSQPHAPISASPCNQSHDTHTKFVCTPDTDKKAGNALVFDRYGCVLAQVDLFKFWDDPSEEYRREKTVAQDIMIDLFATSLGEKPVGKLEWGISDVDDQPPPYTLTPGQSTNVGLETQLQQGPKEAGAS